MNLYTCIRLCLYLYMCVFSWRNPHLELTHFVVIHNIHIYTHIRTYTYIRLSLYLYMCVFRWRNPHIEQITFCHYPFNIYIHIFEPVYLYTFVSILVHVCIQVAKPTLRTNHILPLSIYIYIYIWIYINIYTHLNRYICIRLCLCLYMRVFRWRNPHFEKITFCRYP